MPTEQGEQPAPTPPIGQDLDHRRVLVIIGALLLGMLLAALDQTIVATALPTIAGDLHGLADLSWVVTAYILASTASTPLWGKLGDLYGRKTFFQAAIVIFLVGSALSGLSGSMAELVAFRGLQGIGGGGLMIGAQAIIADVVSPRDRGRYQGLFGAVFGVTSVIGPLIGGFFVQHLTWRWVFYVNIPVGAVALVATGIVLPKVPTRVQHVIDYLGTLLLAGAATGLVLLTTLGGTTYPWGSPEIMAMGVGSLLLLAAFVAVERRAAEPVLPLRLFRNRVFSASSAIGFVVGFAMFGAITYLPQYMQVVKGQSPTNSGLQLLPLMLGLLATSMVSGWLISKWGRYKVFPIAGTAVMTVGMFLLSRLGVETSTFAGAVYMFVLGVGIGGVMQVLVIAVQNDVDYRDLGVATSGASFFRSIGGSFGTAAFGAIFVNRLNVNISHYLGGVKLPPGFSATAGASPAVLDRLPAPVHTGLVQAFAASLQTVFLVAVPVSVVAFVLTWLLKEVPLRRAAGAPDQAQSLAPTAEPAARNSVDEVMRALSLIAGREDRSRAYRSLAAEADLDLDPRSTWLLFRFDRTPDVPLEAMAAHLGLPADDLRLVLAPLAEADLVRLSPAATDGGRVTVTEAGARAIETLVAARRRALTRMLGSWSEEMDAELATRIEALARDLLRDPDRRRQFMAPAATPGR